MRMTTPLVLGITAILACACSSTPPPDDPAGKSDGAATSTPPDDPPPGSNVDLSDTSTPVEMPHGAKNVTGDSIPDDYSLTERDCVDLGKKLGSLWATDLRAGLSPKLSAKQREKAEESIVEGSTKKADDWADGCIKSLAGKTVDPNVLKCAFDSKDLKAFEKCLN